jgi:hypothetical protein
VLEPQEHLWGGGSLLLQKEMSSLKELSHYFFLNLAENYQLCQAI